MLITIYFSLGKFLGSLRVFDKFSPLVTMIEKVLWSLATFLIFYLILLAFFAIMFGVLRSKADGNMDPHGEGEYVHLPELLTDYLYVFRTAAGDFEYNAM